MKVIFSTTRPPAPRTHPWDGMSTDPEAQYYDFVEHPELIETSLEHVRPWARQPAVQTFYKLLRWLNGTESQFRTNDCGLGSTQTLEKVAVEPWEGGLKIYGRLTFFWRELNRNNWAGWVDLNRAFKEQLEKIDPEWQGAIMWTQPWETIFTETSLVGGIVIFEFRALGATDDAVWSNLDRLFKNLEVAFKAINGLATPSFN